MVQLTVAQFHQDLESEKLERQTLQLLVPQLQRDITFIQNIRANQNTRTSPKPFSIDPPIGGTVTNPSMPEIHEPLRAPASQFILMGNSEIPTSTELPSSTNPGQTSSNPHLFPTTTPPGLPSKFNALEKQLDDDVSRQKFVFSSLQSNYTFL